MTADIELLPCPFCGGTSTLTDKDSPICPVGHILCDDCYASADSTRWNQRATAAKDAEIEALRAAKARLSRSLKEAIVYGNRQAGRAERLAEALRELLIDMMLAQSSMRRAAKTDPRWEGCDEAIQPRVDAARAALRDHDQEGGDG